MNVTRTQGDDTMSKRGDQTARTARQAAKAARQDAAHSRRQLASAKTDTERETFQRSIARAERTIRDNERRTY